MWPALLQTVVALVLVSALAWVVLRLAGARLGKGRAHAGLRVLSQVRLLDGHAVYLLEAGGRYLLLGGGQGGLALLAEMDAAQVAAMTAGKERT